jgi:hypothetical protein
MKLSRQAFHPNLSRKSWPLCSGLIQMIKLQLPTSQQRRSGCVELMDRKVFVK